MHERVRETGISGRTLRFVGLAVGCFVLAGCAGTSKMQSKHGADASTRVAEADGAMPEGGGYYHLGRPYAVSGRTYVPQVNTHYSAVGLASWYGPQFHGHRTANGEIFDQNAISAAHPTLPLPSYVRVTNLANHKSMVVRVNDRGPFAGNRVIDLSRKTAQLLGFFSEGVAKVKVDYVGPAPVGSSEGKTSRLASDRAGSPAPSDQGARDVNGHSDNNTNPRGKSAAPVVTDAHGLY
jgi:rare lipoprotein A